MTDVRWLMAELHTGTDPLCKIEKHMMHVERLTESTKSRVNAQAVNQYKG